MALNLGAPAADNYSWRHAYPSLLSARQLAARDIVSVDLKVRMTKTGVDRRETP